MHNLIIKFSVTDECLNYTDAEIPGATHKSCILGYALVVSFGAVVDKPGLAVGCNIRGREADTEPRVVIPITPVNGIKINEETIYGCMDNIAHGSLNRLRILAISAALLSETFLRFEESKNCTFRETYHEAAMVGHRGANAERLEWAEEDGRRVCRRVFPTPPSTTYESEIRFSALYGLDELFKKDGTPAKYILDNIPTKDEKKLAVEKGIKASSMQPCNFLMDKAFRENSHSLRLFSPDEVFSKNLTQYLITLDEISNGTSSRIHKLSKPVPTEHCCLSFMQSYTLIERVTLFLSYEIVLAIIRNMMFQHVKFGKTEQGTCWRCPLAVSIISRCYPSPVKEKQLQPPNPSFNGAVLHLIHIFLGISSTKSKLLLIHTHTLSSIKAWCQFHVPRKQKHILRWGLQSGNLQAIGEELTFKVYKAAGLHREVATHLLARVLNVTELMVLGTEEDRLTTILFDMVLLSHIFKYHIMELRREVKLVALLVDLKHRIQKTRDLILKLQVKAACFTKDDSLRRGTFNPGYILGVTGVVPGDDKRQCQEIDDDTLPTFKSNLHSLSNFIPLPFLRFLSGTFLPSHYEVKVRSKLGSIPCVKIVLDINQLTDVRFSLVALSLTLPTLLRTYQSRGSPSVGDISLDGQVFTERGVSSAAFGSEARGSKKMLAIDRTSQVGYTL
ncbi:uncharacterized protein BDR25DRAFT_347952 [Lindgomyces ingoldianus]|uniref:Uncharacterized protein n=1 Tax=Lindgomyces ingoldianus TaxID=673940 RepID=A0ACB6RE40_9PLEO|nr:uncharacterized protein BDR25DRAFT_347952 [Lindgomyces ingoldianus]KAF2477619.1 hypothetical protein BDR25DRAFT_347952 [Lindgomyces ingoldianus]